LASTAFRALMAITARFDLETVQMDAVNAFVNCHLDEVVYMKMPPGFEVKDKVLRLRKALYGLRRSPLLWQTELTKTFRDLGFKELPQEPCVMIRGGVIVFFYVDDIVFCYRKSEEAVAKEAIRGLEARYTMSALGELKWFLGIHVLRDRSKRFIWLSQQAYVEKIAGQYNIDLKKIDTPMASDQDLRLFDGVATKRSIIQYQKKTGSALFAAITTRPDVAFAVSRLTQFNHNPSEDHHKAIDRVIQYLYSTRDRAIRFGDGAPGVQAFICASDASFADNAADRKSSQGYIMKLFGGPIAWRANKQDTVTTSSTEAELLALSQTAKEAIYTRRLLEAMKLNFGEDERLSIKCDNLQTLRLIREPQAKLITKLRHVDIHNHWLRQEFAQGRVNFEWISTKEMIADGLTKALPRQRFEVFVRLIGLDDITERLQRERRLEELKDRIQEA
jgi:Reverse transcriptase (RNA-dependent DNA polymerase)